MPARGGKLTGLRESVKGNKAEGGIIPFLLSLQPSAFSLLLSVVFMEAVSIIAVCANALLASRSGVFSVTEACVDQSAWPALSKGAARPGGFALYSHRVGGCGDAPFLLIFSGAEEK